MRITRKALERICGIRRANNLPAETGVRLGLVEGIVFLQWDGAGPADGDFVLNKSGIAIFVDAGLYPRLADYTLDFAAESRREGFVFSRNPGLTENGGAGKERLQ